MIKRIYILLIFGHVSFFTFGQMLTCEKLAKQMEANTTKSIWNYDSIPPDIYNCLGMYFAQRDIEKKVFLIHTYGLAKWTNPCIVCRYRSYGYSFYYHEDIILDNVTNFIEGYNEISEAYLKDKVGDSEFLHLNVIPKENFNPTEVLTKNLNNGDHQRFFDIDIINDTTINVKLVVDSLFKDYPQFLSKIVYDIADYKNESPRQTQKMNYQQIKDVGFRLTEKSNDTYFFKINFDFKALASEEKYCWCAIMDKMEYSFIIPLKVKY